MSIKALRDEMKLVRDRLKVVRQARESMLQSLHTLSNCTDEQMTKLSSLKRLREANAAADESEGEEDGDEEDSSDKYHYFDGDAMAYIRAIIGSRPKFTSGWAYWGPNHKGQFGKQVIRLDPVDVRLKYRIDVVVVVVRIMGNVVNHYLENNEALIEQHEMLFGTGAEDEAENNDDGTTKVRYLTFTDNAALAADPDLDESDEDRFAFQRRYYDADLLFDETVRADFLRYFQFVAQHARGAVPQAVWTILRDNMLPKWDMTEYESLCDCGVMNVWKAAGEDKWTFPPNAISAAIAFKNTHMKPETFTVKVKDANTGALVEKQEQRWEWKYNPGAQFWTAPPDALDALLATLTT